MTATQLLTAAEFARLPNPADGSKQELVRGRIVQLPPPKGRHGQIQLEIGARLREVVKPNRLGWVVTESGVVLDTDPDTVRGPDVSFYSIARVPQREVGYYEVPPDLAVEILSPDDRRPKVISTIREYITAGVKLVWLVDPETNVVTVYSGNMRGVDHHDGDTLDGGTVLPGFTCPIADLFQ